MPAAVAVPLIVGAASAGTSLIGAKMASNASKNAAKTQSDAAAQAQLQTRQDTDRALQYIMGQQGQAQRPMQSSPAYARMYQGLGFGAPHAPMNGGMVTLQSPTGQTKQVPAEQVEHYVQMGARRV